MRALRLVLLLASLATPAVADYLRTVPPAPSSNDQILVEVGGMWGNGCVPRHPTVTRKGNEIDLDLQAAGDGFACLSTSTLWQERVTIGTLPPGAYTVRVRITLGDGRRTEWRTVTFPVTQANAAYAVTPPVGSTAGGTDVFIGGYFGACPTVPPCFVPQVLFGGVAAASIREVPSGIIATSPAHAPGIVDLELRGRAGTTIATLPSAFTFAAAGLPGQAYTPVLVPLMFSGPGAAGSEWITEASAYNDGLVAITPLNRDAVTTCPANVSPCPAPPFASRAWDTFHHTASYPSGLILWIPRAQAADLHFSVHARDLSRSTENAGTEVPVIGEEEIVGQKLHLLNIPVRPGFRQMLRVYELGGSSRAQSVVVTMYSKTGELLGNRYLTLSSPDEVCFRSDSTCTPTRPRYGAINDFLPQIPPPGIDSVRLVIESGDRSARLWAFVTVTNNATQLFTTVTPQPAETGKE